MVIQGGATAPSVASSMPVSGVAFSIVPACASISAIAPLAARCSCRVAKALEWPPVGSCRIAKARGQDLAFGVIAAETDGQARGVSVVALHGELRGVT